MIMLNEYMQCKCKGNLCLCQVYPISLHHICNIILSLTLIYEFKLTWAQQLGPSLSHIISLISNWVNSCSFHSAYLYITFMLEIYLGDMVSLSHERSQLRFHSAGSSVMRGQEYKVEWGDLRQTPFPRKWRTPGTLNIGLSGLFIGEFPDEFP